MPAAGEMAPDFTLPREDGGSITLSALRPGKAVVYFYPKADTPGCTAEALDFTRLRAAFAAAGATVIGISKDSLAAQDRFCRKHGLGIVLASDAAGTVCEDWGVWVEKSMYGKKYFGIERATFVVDGTGRIARVWPKVKVPGHAEAVLAAVQAL
jgi:peroxiredoxin Q/BCP